MDASAHLASTVSSEPCCTAKQAASNGLSAPEGWRQLFVILLQAISASVQGAALKRLVSDTLAGRNMPLLRLLADEKVRLLCH